MKVATSAVVVATVTLYGCQQTKTLAQDKGIYDRDHNSLPIDQVNSSLVDWRALDKSRDGITGIGVLNLPAVVTSVDMCTAFLIDQHVDHAPAYIVTNAHCTLHAVFAPLKTNEVRQNEDTSFEVVFNHFVSVPANQRKRYKLAKLVYYTEKGMDLAIFQLEKTLNRLKKDGIKPLTVSPKKPASGPNAHLVGIPLLRVPEDQKSLHITGPCRLFGNAHLKNGIYEAPRSVIHNCSSIEGFSGGPVIDAASGEVVLINSHGDAGDSTDAPCTYASRPCEVDANGATNVVPKRNYGQYLDAISRCFNTAGRFDVSRPTCDLPKP